MCVGGEHNGRRILETSLHMTLRHYLQLSHSKSEWSSCYPTSRRRGKKERKNHAWITCIQKPIYGNASKQRTCLFTKQPSEDSVTATGSWKEITLTRLYRPVLPNMQDQIFCLSCSQEVCGNIPVETYHRCTIRCMLPHFVVCRAFLLLYISRLHQDDKNLRSSLSSTLPPQCLHSPVNNLPNEETGDLKSLHTFF